MSVDGPAEWLFEHGIGEDRAALVQNGTILEAIIDPDDGRLRAGLVAQGRLIALPGLVRLDSGEEILVDHAPGFTEGASVTVELVREAIPEPGAVKRAKGRLTDSPSRPAPSLHDQLVQTGFPIRTVHPHEEDALEAAGWSEVLEEASTGQVAFAGGRLRIALTPAMTVIDVDGTAPPGTLAVAGARAAARAIRRLGLGGSIGIDLPTCDRTAREAAAAMIDATLPKPFERTAVNGFGFVQIVRKRSRPSLAEQMQFDPGAPARAMLRRHIRDQLRMSHPLRFPKEISDWLKYQPHFQSLISRVTGYPAAHN